MSRLLAAIAAVLALSVHPLAAHAQGQPWTTVGSGGTVNPLSLGMLTLSGPFATASTTSTAAMITYNVVSVPGLLVGGDGLAMSARFLDSGADARVRLFLYKTSLATGASSLVLSLDSDSYAASPSYQRQGVVRCGAPAFDFFNNAYYVVALIGRSASSASSSLHSIQITPTLC